MLTVETGADGTVELLSNIHANARPRYDFVLKTTSTEPLDLSRILSHLRSQPDKTVYAGPSPSLSPSFSPVD